MNRNLLGNLYQINGRFALIVVLLFCVLGAKAQTVDYSGTYYIGVYGKNSTSQYTPNNPNNTNNYYLCPTENWLYYVATNNCQHTPDNGQPFLTSYKCKLHVNDTDPYDLTKAVWVITKHSTSNYYYIQQRSTGKYLVYNGSIGNTSGTGLNRIRVHLETIEAPNEPDDNACFVISTVSTNNDRNGYWLFHPINAGDGIYMNISDGNYDQLIGTSGKTDGPTVANYPGSKNVGGTIGQWNDPNNTSSFYLEDYITRPTIAYNADPTSSNYNKIEITTAQTGVDLIYTTDGSTPSTTNPNATTISGTPGNITTTSFDPTDDVTTIKAIAMVNGEASNEATYNIFLHFGSTHPRLIQNQGNPWTFVNSPNDYHFYMIPGDDVSNVTKVNTTSLFRPSMEWYFSNAGIEDGVQYYYIVNYTNSKYLCYDDTYDVYMESFNSGDDKFKFKIVESPTTGTYNFIPYGQSKKFIYKSSGNGSDEAVILRAENVNTSNNVHARWKFILPSELDRNAPFNASDPTNLSYPYYTITTASTSNNVTTTYYIAPGATYIQTLTSNDASALWYFEVAQAADATDWLTYYHIRNVVTGDYLYFDKDSYDSNNTASCFKTSGEVDPTADSCMFTWAKTASATANYYIVPKSMKDASQNKISTLYRYSNSNIRLEQTRIAETRAWTFNESNSFTFTPPTISYDATQGGYVISSTETGAEYYYTTDGTTPVPINTTTHYTDAIEVANWPDPAVTSLTINAVAARNGDGSDASTEVSKTVYRVSTPAFSLQTNGTVKITCDTLGASIYYAMNADFQPTSVTIDPSNLYTGPIENAGGQYITAIAVKDGLINSYLATSGQIVFACATPIIRKTTATTFTIECSFPSTDVTIYYNTGDGTQAAPSPLPENEYPGPVTFLLNDLPFTVKAVAYADGYNPSAVATQELTVDLIPDEDGYYVIATDDDFGTFVSMVNGNATNAGAKYKIIEDISVSGVGEITYPFTGELKSVAKADGTFPVVSNLSHAIFNTVNGGKVKNVMLDNVTISSGTNVGAICNEATGDSRIYNCGVLATNSTVATDDKGYTSITFCSSTIRGDDNVGGIVGMLDDSSRVINCFSYADIKGGYLVGGIVGKNNVATTSNNQKTMVMNCMFYGDFEVDACDSIAPIYNGEIITNDGDSAGVNNFNYFRSEASYVQNQNINVYNCALAAETRFLQRFEFFRHLLNSNRTLAAWWVTGNRDNKDEIMKWVMEPNQIGTSTPYPILKTPDEYPSVVNFIPSETLIDENNEHRNEGRKLGTLTVNIRMGSGGAVYGPPTGAEISNNDTILIITDKDPAHFNFNYGKVQLPYYNQVGTKNYNGNRVVTGWKIVSISGGTPGEYTVGPSNAPADYPAYNFADRKCTNKDLYGTGGSNRIFNQGAYWDVPEGVTAITIEPYWAKCVYLSDSYLDIVYKNGMFDDNIRHDAMKTAGSVTSIGGDFHYNNGGVYNINGGNQKVYTTIGSATTALAPSSGTVYDNAVVLVGNYHYFPGANNAAVGNSSHIYTVMSIDLDFDNEPDASLIMRFNGRARTHPVRYDFLNLIGLGMAQKVTGPNSNGTYNFGIMQPYGWFEVTNTALFRCTQFEYSRVDRVKNPIILQGGVVEQWVTVQNKADDKVEYFLVGGNVWFKEFHRGTHQDQDQGSGNDVSSTPHPPISVTGGDFDEFYLTGLYQPKATIYDDNAECYINGGRFGVMAGAGMEGIGTTEGNGNITWIIDNADINEFYGGGINASKPVFGNISTTISNSHVDSLFCGGPKFGDMKNSRTVTTVATNCTFKTFFGAGYGGNSYSRRAPYNRNNVINLPGYGQNQTYYNSWNDWVNEEYTQKYAAAYSGVETQINYQFIPHSSNIDNVARLWVEYVGFSLATTHIVSSTLTGCTVIKNFYGGGSLGMVDVSVTSVLDSCKVKGNVFGAGFSVNLPPVEVMKLGGFQTPPHYDEQAGVFLNHVYPETDTYTWEHAETVNSTETAINTNDHILYTKEDLNTLGTVSGNVSLTIKGKSVIGTEGDSNSGHVYGGGDQSAVTQSIVNGNPVANTGNTTVILQGKTHVLGNVYGGGNLGSVSGNATVSIEGPTAGEGGGGASGGSSSEP